MPFWIPLLISLAFAIAGQLLAPKVQGPKPDERPQIPDIDETRPIPVLWGEWLIQQPQLFWWGDYQVNPIKKKVFTGLWFKKVTTGFKYSLGMALGLCDAGSGNNPFVNSRGIEAITELQVNEKTLWTGSGVQGSIFVVDLPAFFGGNGDGGNGGVKAQIEVHTGDYTPGLFQVVSSYLTGQLERTPTWKGLAYIVWRGPSAGYGYFGNSSSIEAIAVKAHRRPNVGLLPLVGTETFAYLPGTNDANPVHCLLELFLNEDWGMGDMTLDDIDSTAWRAAAETCYNEGNGFSYYWDRQSSIEDMADIILKQIDGVVYTDFATGLLTLKLARNDYDVEDLPVYDNDAFLEISSLTRGSWDDTINEVRVTYTDHSKNFKSVSVFDQDLANFVIQDSLGVSVNINYPGVSNETLARQLARRDLQVLTQPLLRFSGTIDRTAHNLNPGDAFVFSWPEQGIDAVVMRVTTVRLGTLQSGVIELECVEDKFATATALFTETGTGWTTPDEEPAEVTDGEIAETPYYISGTDEATVYGVGSRPNSAQRSYQLIAEGEVEDAVSGFTPSGTLVGPLVAYLGGISASVPIENIVDIGALSGITVATALIRINDEYMTVSSIVSIDTDALTATLVNVNRGMLDTVPQAHAAGDKVWFVGIEISQTETAYTDGQTINAEFLTQTSSGILTSADADDYSTTIGLRALKPYRPTSFVLNGSFVLEVVPDTGDVNLNWALRNRLTETVPLRGGGIDPSVDPELTAELFLKIYGDANVLLRTETLEPTAIAYSYTNAMEIADAGSLQGALTFQLYSKRDGLFSHQAFTRRGIRTGGVLPGSLPAYSPVNSYVAPPEGNIINGIPVVGLPTDGQVLVYNTVTNQWEPADASGISGGSITVEEIDGTPSVAAVTKIKVQNYTLVSEGAGVVRIDTNLDLILTADSEVLVDEISGEVVYYA